MEKILKKLENKEDLSFDESVNAFETIMDRKANDQQMYDFLTLLSDKGEQASEIAGGVYVLRNKAKRVKILDAVDTCGTGGDGAETFNISTAVAFTAAACGATVAKHGNRSASGKVGSADVLEALDLELQAPLEKVVQAVVDTKITFLFAPAWHQSLVNLAPLRKSLGIRNSPTTPPTIIANNVPAPGITVSERAPISFNKP